MTRTELVSAVRGIVGTQLFGVLATDGPRGPHTTIISFVVADDLHTLIFATPRRTRKFANLAARRQVSVMIDNRTNQKDDLYQVYGVEARGRAEVLKGPERRTYEELFHAKYPELITFSNASALVKIDVKRYDVVHRFQNVLVLEFDGAGEGDT